jgi:hypothetical protein
VVLRIRPTDREGMAKRMLAMATELQELLHEKYILNYGALYLQRHIPPLRNLIEALKEENEPHPKLDKFLGLKQQTDISAKENLIGQLMRIFETHFKRDAGYSKDPYHRGAVGGPFVRFAEAVLKEAGILYEIKSIASAVDKLRRANPVK